MSAVPDGKVVRVFFSWQSDDDFSRKAIRAALRTASTEAEAHSPNSGLKLEIDEATKRVSGSPNVPDKVREKIEAADIFVADISTINREASNVKRRTPNPNVVFELGYAVAHVGWDRVILLFNTAVGDLKNDPPFDFDRHRISQFRLDPATITTDKAGKQALANLLSEAIKLVIEKDSKRPAELKGLTPEQTRRQRDLENLRWILGAIHWPVIDEHVQNAPHNISQELFFHWESFHGILESSEFRVNDLQVSAELQEFHNHWQTTVSFGQHYESNYAGTSIFKCSHPGGTPRESDDFKKMEKAARAMRNRYVELDISELSAEANRRRIAFHVS